MVGLKLVDFCHSPAGTFKRRFRRNMKENGFRFGTGISYAHGKGFFVDGKNIKDEPLIVLANRTIPGLERILLKRDRTWIINPVSRATMTKAEQQFILATNGIPTPFFTIGTDNMIVPRGNIIKPLRGQKGYGVIMSAGQASKYYQDFIGLPADLPTAFDIRIYTFIGEYLGSVLRMANPSRKRIIGDVQFGISNTERGGKMVYFDRTLKHRCPRDWLPHFEAIRSWLGFSYPTEKMISFARKTAKILGLGYVAIDIIFNKEKTPFVVDVNPNAMHGYRTKADRVRMMRTMSILKSKGWT